MCGTDGMQAHGLGLGQVIGHDTEAVKSVGTWYLRFFVAAVPRGGYPRQPVFSLADACLGSLHGVLMATR